MKTKTLTAAAVLSAAALAASGPAAAQAPFADVGKQAQITILINSSPWFGGFEKAVDLYEKQNGNKVKLDVTPYGGMLEKARNAVRTGSSPYDILNLDALWTIEFYEGNFLKADRRDRRGLLPAVRSPDVRGFELLERGQALAHARRRPADGLFAQRQHPRPLLSRGPPAAGRPPAAQDMGRRGRDLPEAEQSAQHVRVHHARREGQPDPLRLDAVHAGRRGFDREGARRTATTPSRSTRRRPSGRSTSSSRCRRTVRRRMSACSARAT